MMKPGPYLIWGLLGAAAIVVIGVFLAQSTLTRSETLSEEGVLRTSAILGGRNHRNAMASFSGGDLTALMGGIQLDLSSSSMSGDEAEVDLFVMMGGIDLRIPRGWIVISDMDLLLGGIDDKSQKPDSATAKRLVLRGTVLMGGVSIRN
jgi:hypothetical protein